MIIREANKNDLVEILALIKQLIDKHRQIDPYYKPFKDYRGLKSHIAHAVKDPNKLVLVAENSDQILGYFMGEIEEAPFYSSEKYIGVVADTCVDKKLRRHGILKKLFGEAIKWFKEKRVNYIELSVDARNREAVAAWRKLGFSDYKLRLRTRT
jgi:ribosomal protein S18 acetylase RimI-like enzyme